jgi:hypothetical protein
MMPFAPHIVAADRLYNERDKIRKEPDSLNRLYAGHLYRTWLTRR